MTQVQRKPATKPQSADPRPKKDMPETVTRNVMSEASLCFSSDSEVVKLEARVPSKAIPARVAVSPAGRRANSATTEAPKTPIPR